MANGNTSIVGWLSDYFRQQWTEREEETGRPMGVQNIAALKAMEFLTPPPMTDESGNISPEALQWIALGTMGKGGKGGRPEWWKKAVQEKKVKPAKVKPAETAHKGYIPVEKRQYPRSPYPYDKPTMPEIEKGEIVLGKGGKWVTREEAEKARILGKGYRTAAEKAEEQSLRFSDYHASQWKLNRKMKTPIWKSMDKETKVKFVKRMQRKDMADKERWETTVQKYREDEIVNELIDEAGGGTRPIWWRESVIRKNPKRFSKTRVKEGEYEHRFGELPDYNKIIKGIKKGEKARPPTKELTLEEKIAAGKKAMEPYTKKRLAYLKKHPHLDPRVQEAAQSKWAREKELSMRLEPIEQIGKLGKKNRAIIEKFAEEAPDVFDANVKSIGSLINLRSLGQISDKKFREALARFFTKPTTSTKFAPKPMTPEQARRLEERRLEWIKQQEGGK